MYLDLLRKLPRRYQDNGAGTVTASSELLSFAQPVVRDGLGGCANHHEPST